MLPRMLLLVTCEQVISHCDILEQATTAGLDGIMLRDKRANGGQLCQAGHQLRQLCSRTSTFWAVNEHLDIAQVCDSDGFHSPAVGTGTEDSKFHCPGFVSGKSVHSLDEAVTAETEGFSYVLYSPIFTSSCKPDCIPKGLDSLREVTSTLRIPVYALGGVDATNARACRAAGAYGVAFISAFFQSGNPLVSMQNMKQELEL